MSRIDKRPDDFNEEEYREDARYWMQWMLDEGFHAVPFSNDTFEGRVKSELSCMLRDIETLRFPTPYEHWGTIKYLVGDGSLDDFPGFEEGTGRLYWILGGEGIMKQRHLPKIAEYAVDCIEFLEEQDPDLAVTQQGQRLISELRKISIDILKGNCQHPLDREALPELRYEINNVPSKPEISERRLHEMIEGLRRYEDKVYVHLTEFRRPKVTMLTRDSWPQWLQGVID